MAPPVMVIGCGSSGTSATTRVINFLGVPLDADATVKGEQLAFQLNNDALLRLVHGTWTQPRAAAFQRARVPKRLYRKLKAPVDAWRARGTSWLWKDPRSSITWPKWHELLSPWVAVLVVRNPSEVADSLAANWGITDRRKALALWELYTRCAVLGARAAHASTIVHYADLLRDPAAVCAKLDAFLSSAGVVRGPADLEAATAWPRQELRHHQLELEGVTAEQAQLYETLVAGELPAEEPDLVRLDAALA